MKVVIIGGGMSGATLALALENITDGKIEIEVIESTLLDETLHPGFDARAIAIADGTFRKLKQLDLWQYFSTDATSIKKIVVSDRGHLGRVEINSDEYHVNALGHVVSLFSVGQALYEGIQKSDNIKLWAPYSVIDIKRDINKAYISLERNQKYPMTKDMSTRIEIEADLVVIADGTYSKCAEILKIQRHIHDYGQWGLITNLVVSEPHQNQAFELFTDEGPIALLPLPNNQMTLVWCAKAENIQDKMALSDAGFINALQAHFGWRAGKFLKTGKRFSYPLTLNIASMPISHRTVLVGNAAQTLHPIAGQGFNLGMRDIVTFCDIIQSAVQNNLDIGSYPILADYLNKRKEDRSDTINLTDQLLKVFSNNEIPKIIARNIGLSVMSHIKPLKDKVAHQALGWVY